MPFCDGLEMTLKIKELDESIPIIVLSAHSDKEKLLTQITFIDADGYQNLNNIWNHKKCKQFFLKINLPCKLFYVLYIR